MENIESIPADGKRLAPQKVWARLEGKRLFCLGADTKRKQCFLKNLANFYVSQNLEEVKSGDFVFLFGDFETSDAEYFLVWLQILERLARIRPEAVLLITDSRIYGKRFGGQRALAEEELGYVSHTSERDGCLQDMRAAEYFACRMARENGLAIRIARMDGPLTGDALEVQLAGAVSVLLDGAGAETYNLPGGGTLGGGLQKMEDGKAQESRKRSEGSPLSPVPVILNTEKFERSFGKRNGCAE